MTAGDDVPQLSDGPKVRIGSRLKTERQRRGLSLRTLALMARSGDLLTGVMHDGHVELDDLAYCVRCRTATMPAPGTRVVVRIENVSLAQRLADALIVCDCT
jgi:hypothetical protein